MALEVIALIKIENQVYFRVASAANTKPDVTELVKALNPPISGRIITQGTPYLWEGDPPRRTIWHGVILPTTKKRELKRDLETLDELEKKARYLVWESSQHGQVIVTQIDLLFRLETILVSGLSQWRVHPGLIALLTELIKKELLDGEFPMRTDTALLTVAEGWTSGYRLNELQGGWKWVIADPEDQKDEPLLTIHDIPSDPDHVHLHFGAKWASITEAAVKLVT